MKLTKILWPEIFKGNRGPKPLVEISKKVVAQLYFKDYGIEVNCEENFPEVLMPFLKDSNSSSSFIQAKRHMLEKSPVYHVCEDFCRALWKVPDRELPVAMIPDGFKAYVSFPQGLLFDDTEIPRSNKRGEEISGAYIFVGTADEHIPVVPALRGSKVVWISYLGEPERAVAEGRFPGLGRLLFLLKEGSSVAEMLQDITNSDYLNSTFGQTEVKVSATEIEFRRKLASLLLNVALYVNSEDSELLKLTPTFNASHSHIKKSTQKGHVNGCSIAVTAVNWSYAKDPANLDEVETFVDTFPRWQRMGPRLSQIKLIWVRPHTRTYLKSLEKENA